MEEKQHASTIQETPGVKFLNCFEEATLLQPIPCPYSVGHRYLASHRLLFLEIVEASRKDQYFRPRRSLKLFEPLGRHLAESQKSVPSSTVKVIWDNS